MGVNFSDFSVGLPTGEEELQNYIQRLSPQSNIGASAGLMNNAGLDDLNGGGGIFGDMFSNPSTFSNFAAGAKGIGSLFSAFNGLKELKLANEQFDFQKEYANRNLENQANTLNAQLTDRQNQRVERARRNGNPNSVQSTQSYMQQFGTNGQRI